MKYRVNTHENKCGIQIEAEEMDVTFNGTLLLANGDKIVAAYAAGNWTDAKQITE